MFQCNREVSSLIKLAKICWSRTFASESVGTWWSSRLKCYAYTTHSCMTGKWFIMESNIIISRHWHCDAKGLIFYCCGLSFFLFSTFFPRLISEVTERISTKVGHIFTYDCYMKNMVWTPPGIYPMGWWAKNRFWDQLWTLTEHISTTEQDINNRKEIFNLKGLPYMPPKFCELWSRNGENGWRVFVHPINFHIGRHCQPYRMDVI